MTMRGSCVGMCCALMVLASVSWAQQSGVFDGSLVGGRPPVVAHEPASGQGGLMLAQAAGDMVQATGRQMKITIGEHHFEAELADTRAAAELREMLPLTLQMSDHARNEKFAGLSRRLSANDSRPGRIEAGDILLWQGNTLVVFYESFDSSYRYTRLGRIRDVQGLKAALGAGDVAVTFAGQ